MNLTKTPFAFIPFVASMMIAAPAQADEKELLERVDQLAHEVEALRAEVKALKEQQPQPQAPAASVASAAPAEAPATVLTSYGEVNVTMPTDDSSATTLDLRRFVLGYQHRFDEKTKVV